MTIKELKDQLFKLLANFNIPEDKKGNIQWLLQNITIKNTGHRDLPEVMEVLKSLQRLLSEERKKLIKH